MKSSNPPKSIIEKDFNESSRGIEIDNGEHLSNEYPLRKTTFEKLSTPISKSDEKDTAIVKVVIAENDELRQRIKRLENISDEHFRIQKKLGAYEEREKKSASHDIFYDFIISGAGLMSAFATWDYSKIKINNFIILGFAILFIGGSIIIRRWDKK